MPNINGHFVQKSLSGPRRTLQTDRAIRVTKVVSKFIYHLFIYYARNNIHVHRECRKIIIENKTVKQNEKITNQETRRKKSHPDANAVINVTNRYQLWLRNTILGRTDRISLRHDFANSLSIPRAFSATKSVDDVEWRPAERTCTVAPSKSDCTCTCQCRGDVCLSS